MTTPTRIAIIGLGGIARSLAVACANAGAIVTAFDPAVRKLAGVSLAASAMDALQEAHLVIAFSSPMTATKAARDVVHMLPAGAVYVDLNSGTPSFKRGLATMFADGAFADGAVVVTGDEDDPEIALSVSGSGAARCVDILASVGIEVELVSGSAGDAAARTLLRSLLREGISNALVDTLWAAESLGMQDWAYAEILRELDAGSAQNVRENLASTSKNFKRLQMDMQDVLEMLSESGYESTMLAPIQFNHGRIMHGKKIPHAQG